MVPIVLLIVLISALPSGCPAPLGEVPAQSPPAPSGL